VDRRATAWAGAPAMGSCRPEDDWRRAPEFGGFSATHRAHSTLVGDHRSRHDLFPAAVDPSAGVVTVT
jgi:hypothetical protein